MFNKILSFIYSKEYLVFDFLEIFFVTYEKITNNNLKKYKNNIENYLFIDETINQIINIAIKQNKKIYFLLNEQIDIKFANFILKSFKDEREFSFINSMNEIDAILDSCAYITNKIYKNKKMNTFLYSNFYKRYRKNNKRAKEFLKQQNNSITGKIFIFLLSYNNQFKQKEYWFRIGYEFGGLMCYSYVEWIIKTLKNKNIEKVLFIARDGYILKYIFDKINLNKKIESLYIYASRQLFQNCCLDEAIKRNKVGAIFEYAKNKIEINTDNMKNNNDIMKFINKNYTLFKKLSDMEFQEYAKYMQSKNIFKEDKVAMVDSMTDAFSAQTLITSYINKNNVLGLYWMVVFENEFKNLRKEFNFQQFSKKHTDFGYIECWNFYEYILTSNEYPIKCIKDKKPLYADKTKEEDKRIENFLNIFSGVVRFVDDIIFLTSNKRNKLKFSEDFVTSWINLLYTKPNKIDKKKLSETITTSDALHVKNENLFMRH